MGLMEAMVPSCDRAGREAGPLLWQGRAGGDAKCSWVALPLACRVNDEAQRLCFLLTSNRKLQLRPKSKERSGLGEGGRGLGDISVEKQGSHPGLGGCLEGKIDVLGTSQQWSVVVSTTSRQ